MKEGLQNKCVLGVGGEERVIARFQEICRQEGQTFLSHVVPETLKT